MGFFKYTELHIRNSSSELYTGRCSVICITVKVRITFSHCKIIGIIKKKKKWTFPAYEMHVGNWCAISLT